jgi:hypothetical protein
MSKSRDLSQVPNASLGFKNRIINGDMRIDQRNAGASVTVNSTLQFFPVDRWFGIGQSTDGVFTLQQDSSAPEGFVNSVKATVTTADTSLAAGQSYTFQHRIEGYNIADLGWGTANAKTVTLSFWVRSSLTGTFGGSLRNSAGNRSYPFSYTILSANTWEQKSVTIAGDTTGTWLVDNGIGIGVIFSLGSGTDRSGTAGAWATGDFRSVTGAVSVIGTLNATWQITGVQLEKGSTATSFDYRPYGTELALCQRYYQAIAYPRTYMDISGATAYFAPVYFLVSMRAAPTVTLPSGAGNVVLNSSGTATTPIYQWNASNITTNSFSLRGGTVNIAGIVEGTATASAEL